MLNTAPSILALLVLCNLASGQETSQLSEFETAAFAYKSALSNFDASRSDGSEQEVLRAAKELLALGNDVYPESDERLAMLEVHYGNALLIAGQIEEAREILAHALRSLEKIHGKDSAILVPTLVLLADARAEPFNSSEQIKLYKRSLRLVAKRHGKSSSEYAELELSAGRSILSFSNDLDAARDFMTKAYKTYYELLGRSSEETGRAALYLAKLEVAAAQYAQAQNYLLDALQGLAADNPKTLDEHLYARALLVRAYELDGKSDMATEHCVAIGRLATASQNQEISAIFRWPPQYPPGMAELGKEGSVDILFTIDERGFVQSPRVASLIGDEAFADAALDAMRRFRYAPKIENGVPTAVENIGNTITFKLEVLTK